MKRALSTLLRERRVPTLCSLGLVVSAIVLIMRGTPLWWLGASFLVGAAFTLWHAYRAELLQAHQALCRPRAILRCQIVPATLLLDLLYVGIIVWTATYMMRDVLLGVRPVSHDNTVHFVKAWQLHEYFLPHGRLHGWSHRWFAGYPVDYLYPIGTDLFVNVVQLLSFGLLSINAAYGVAFWLGHVLTGYAGFRFGRVVGGPHVGFIAGMLMLTDMSAFRFGGWVYSIEYGVWPQALSLSLALLATARLPAIYEQRRLRDVGIFALYMGASIVTHPIELIYMGIVLLVAVLSAFFVPSVKTAAGTLRLLLGYALAVLVSAAWLLPFMSTRDQVTPMGVWWDSTYEMGKGLLALTAFPGTLGLVLALGMPAAAIMLRSRKFVLMFTALMAILIPAVSSSTFLDEQHLTQLSRSLAKIQWLRMSTMAKPFWFTMAGYFVVAFLRKSRVLGLQKSSEPTEPTQARSYLRDVMLSIVVAYLTLPIVVPACQAFFTANINKALQSESERAEDPDRRALVSWLKHNLPRNDGFYRVCVNTGHNHDLMDLAAELPVPIFKRGFTPAENFIYKVSIEDPAVIEAVNVRFMVTKKPMPEEHYAQLASFGIYRVYRFKHWNPRPYVITQGQGQLKLERFSDDEIVLRAAPGSSGKLRLNVSYFPRWHAYLDGQPISLWPTALKQAPTSSGFMTVMLKPGVYRFAFERSMLDKLAFPISLLGLLFVLVLWLADGSTRGLSWLRRSVERVTEASAALSAPRFARVRFCGFAVLMLGWLGGTIYLAEWQPRLALEELSGIVVKRVRYDFLEQLGSARAHIEYRSGGRRCKRFADRFICRNQDGNLDNEKYIANTPAEIEEYRMVRCIRARPEEDARLVIDYEGVPAGQAIVGYYGVERAGRLMRLTRPVDFQIFIDGKPTYTGATTSDNKMHWFEAKVGGASRTVNVTFTVAAANVIKRYFCFYAQMADVGQGPPSVPGGIQRKYAEDEDEDPN